MGLEGRKGGMGIVGMRWSCDEVEGWLVWFRCGIGLCVVSGKVFI